MKTIYFILIIALFAGCKKAVVDTNEERLFVNKQIGDVTVQEGVVTYEIDISDVFRVYSNSTALIIKSVQSVQNPAMVSAQITGDILELTIAIGETGITKITLRAEYASTVVYESFNLKIEPIAASAAMNQAIQNFQNADYSGAEALFQVVLHKTDTQLYSDAYMGAGFSQMRLDRPGESYQSLQLSLNNDQNNNDARAGLTLLEYAYRRNYSEAIRIGEELLNNAPDFVFRYDTSLDKNDIRLNIALSQFSAQSFQDCLQTVQILDPSFVLSANDPDFESKLAAKLEALVNQYS